MNKYQKLENEINTALERAEPSLEELKRLLSQVQDEALKLKNSDDDYIESRTLLNTLQKDLDTKIKKLETEDKSKRSSEKKVGSEAPKVSVNNSDHTPEAEKLMKQAENLFYQGEYRDAIPIYERVLKLDPNWERAKDHLAEAEESLRTGKIPSVHLPSDVINEMSGLVSAFNNRRLDVAKEKIDSAIELMKAHGLTKWKDGDDWKEKITNFKDAADAYKEGERFFSEGNLTGSIIQMSNAHAATQYPDYKDKLDEYKAVKDKIDIIDHAQQNNPNELLKAIEAYEVLESKYSANPAVEKARTSLVRKIQGSVEQLKNEINGSPKVKEGPTMVNQVKDLSRFLTNGMLPQETQDWINRKFVKATKALDDLNKANDAYDKDRLNSANKHFQKLNEEYSSDPDVNILSRKLSDFQTKRKIWNNALIVLGALILVALLYFGISSIIKQIEQVNLSKTPTATATATLTPTSTATLPPTATATTTPTSTPTPAVYTTVNERSYLRTRCSIDSPMWNTYPIPKGTSLIPIKWDYDASGRGCVYVTYQYGEELISGFLYEDQLKAP